MRFCVTILLAAMVAAGVAQTATTPKTGSAERKAILDAVRVPIQKALHGQKVVFIVKHLKATKDWAFAWGFPAGEKGKKLNWRNSDFKEQYESEAFDENFGALLKRKNGKWLLVTWFVGATDVPWVDWPSRFKAPKSIFPPMGG